MTGIHGSMKKEEALQFTQGTCDRMPRFIGSKKLFPSNPFIADSDYRPRKKLRQIAIALQGNSTPCHTPTYFVFTRRLHYSCFSRQNPRSVSTDGKKPYLPSHSNLCIYHKMFFTMLTKRLIFHLYKPSARKGSIPKDLSLIGEKIYHSNIKRLLLNDRLTQASSSIQVLLAAICKYYLHGKRSLQIDLLSLLRLGECPGLVSQALNVGTVSS